MKTISRVGLGLSSVAISAVALATPAMAAGPSAHVSPNKGLKNAQTVKVTFSGFSPGSTVIVVQCSKPIKSAADASKYCDLHNVKQVPAPTGSGSTSYTVHTGKIGSAGKCVSKSTCVIAVATQSPPAGAFPKITFK